MANREDSATYITIAHPGEGKYVEKMSRFLAFALPAVSADEAKSIITQYSNRFHDARHVCWGYVLGPDRNVRQSSDNGEPSGTAGRPILGAIDSAGVTDVIVVVVRYFGGIKLGTGGLVVAYREAARLALAEAGTIERRQLVMLKLRFAYLDMNNVMRLVKRQGITILSQHFDNTCLMDLSVPVDMVEPFAPYLD